MFAADYETCHAEGCEARATRTHLPHPVCAGRVRRGHVKGHPMSAASSYHSAHLQPGAKLEADTCVSGDHVSTTLTARKDDTFAKLATFYGRAEHAASMAHAFLTAAHEILRHAHLTLDRWDACLRGLDALTETAANKRAEAFYAEHGDAVDRDWVTYPTTDHVRDGHVEGPGDGLCDSCASAGENPHLVGACEQARRELTEGVG